MRRRTFVALGVSACLAGCNAIRGSETVVDETFQSTYRENIEVGAEQTLRVEVTPLDPEYQLVLFVGETETLGEESSMFDAFAELETVDSEVAKEVTPSEDTEYTVGVGWFEDPKDLSTDQYRLRVTIE